MRGLNFRPDTGARERMSRSTLAAWAVALWLVPLACSWSADPVRGALQASNTASSEATAAKPRPSLAQARRQAEILHSAIHATLQVVHHQYYREDEGLRLPAATLKDVFEHLAEEEQVQLRWLAVEGQAMNTDHKPQNQFETDAVKALKSGMKEYETVENGIYRRAAGILLVNQCLKCHVPDRRSTENRTAGLIISIPVGED